jgi:hypothetical protein
MNDAITDTTFVQHNVDEENQLSHWCHQQQIGHYIGIHQDNLWSWSPPKIQGYEISIVVITTTLSPSSPRKS